MLRHPFALALVLTLSASIASTGCDRASNASEQELIQRAKDYEDKNNLKAGIIELKNALQKNPNSVEARQLLGQLYLKSYQGAEAEKELGRALQLGGSREVLLPQIGEALLLMDQPQRVLDEVNIGDSQMSPRNQARILQLRGHALLQLRKTNEACGLFEKSLSLDSTLPQTHWGLAQCAIASRDHPKALAWLQEALRLPTERVRSYLYLADLHLLERRYPNALQAFDAALKLDPHDNKVLFNRATFYLSQNNTAAASRDIEELRKIAPASIPTRFIVALDLFTHKKYVEARDALQSILQSSPDHLPSLMLSGITNQVLGSHQQAESYLKRVLLRSPGNAQARKALALSQIRLKQPDKALETLGPLLQMRNEASALALASEAYQLKNDYTKASSLLESAIRLDPKNGALQTQLGLAHLGVGNTLSAIEQLQSAARQSSGQYDAQSLLALTYLEQKQYDKALEAGGALAQLDARNPVTYDYLGRAYLGKHDTANARKNFTQALTLDSNYFPAANSLGKLDFQERRPELARQRFEQLLKKHPDNILAMMAMAELAAINKQDQEELRWLEKAAQSNAQAFFTHAALVRFYLARKDFSHAREVANKSLSANPDHPAALNLLSVVQLASGDAKGSESTLTKLALKSPNPDTYHRLAMVKISEKKINEARIPLQKALELNPGHLPSLDTFFRLELAEKKPASALLYARRIQASHPHLAMGYIDEGDTQFYLKHIPLAIKAYEQALKLQDDTYTLFKLHGTLKLAGMNREADARLLAWLNAHPNDLVARAYAAEHYMSTKRNREAIAQYEIIQSRVKNNAGIVNNLANLYFVESDPRALATAELAYKLAPENTDILDTLGWILVEQGQAQRGLTLLRKALAKTPKNPSMRYHYAVALAKNHDPANAQMQFLRLLKDSPQFPEAGAARGWLKQLQAKPQVR